MQMPPNSPDLDAAKERLHEYYAKLERSLTDEADNLAKSGFADKRWCAIARTHFEEGVMAFHRALRDFPGDDPNQYGKPFQHQPMPRGFDPSPQSNPDANTPYPPEPFPGGYAVTESGEPDPHQSVIKDYRADGET